MRYNMLEHSNMGTMREKHPDWIWNRSDTHVILAVPGTLDAMKTPVEPGNSFSPGPGTYGISTWVFAEGLLHAPEEKPLEELQWSFLDGHIPVLQSSWTAGDIAVSSSLFTDGDAVKGDIRDYYTVTVENRSLKKTEASLFIVLRSFGAAGGPLKILSLRDGTVHVNGSPLVFPASQPDGFGAVSYTDTGKDISCYLRQGKLPENADVIDDSTWASGAMEYKLSLAPGQSASYDFIIQLHTDHWMLNWISPSAKPYRVEDARQRFIRHWHETLNIGLDLPDKRFADAFHCQLAHMYMFTVDNAPRISPISYPLWWLRDGAYIVNALGKGGFHEFAGNACRDVAHKDAFGGFGSEGDAPGELIWIISDHYLLTGDKDFLKEMYPHIERKAELLIRMRNTAEPIKIFTEFCIPKLMLEPNIDMLCIPSKDGLIMGRMDGHFPIIWVNSFAYLGLRRAAMCALELGFDGSKYDIEAEALKAAIQAKAREIFGQNDRDVNCAFWPTGWASKEDKGILAKFDEFWDKVRCPGGVHEPEPLWTYFEAGQAHNNVLIGYRDRAWVSIEMFLSKHTAPGLYTYHEGMDDENSGMLWQRTRGWDDIRYVTPHGWTAAEVFLLLRDCLVREEDGNIVIGSGVPASWMDSDFAVKGIPTYFGKLSFRYVAGERRLAVETEQGFAGEVISELPLPVEVSVATSK